MAGSEPRNIVFVLTDQERYFANYPTELEVPARRWMMDRGVTFTPAPKPDAEVSAALARAVNQYSVQLVGNRDSSSSQEVFGAAQEGRAAPNPEMRVPSPESDDKPPRPYKGDPTRGFRLPKEPDS